MKFGVEQIDHVEVCVPDRYQAADWYCRVLGMEIVREFEHWAQNPMGPLMIATPNGGTKLALFEGTPEGSREGVGFHLVAFRVSAESFQRFLRSLPELGIMDKSGQVVSPAAVRDHNGSFSIYFVDPYGNGLEVTTYDYDEAKALLT